MRVYSTGVYVSKESYASKVKKSRNTLVEPLNRSQNNTVDLKKKTVPSYGGKISSFQLPKQ